MGNLGNVLRKGVGIGALVLALAGASYAAGPPRKAATPAPKGQSMSQEDLKNYFTTLEILPDPKAGIVGAIGYDINKNKKAEAGEPIEFLNAAGKVVATSTFGDKRLSYVSQKQPVPPAKAGASKSLKLQKITDLGQVFEHIDAARRSPEILEKGEYLVIVDKGVPGRDASDMVIVYSIENKEIDRFNYINPAIAVKPAITYEPLSLDGTPIPTATPLGTSSAAVTKIATVSGNQAPKATPTPQTQAKEGTLKQMLNKVKSEQLTLSGKASAGYAQQTVTGMMFDGQNWKDVYTGPVLDAKLGLKTEDHGKYRFNGGISVDGNFATGSIDSVEDGRFNVGDYVAKILAGAGYTFANKDVLRFNMGPAGGLKKSEFRFPSGNLYSNSLGSGLEAVVELARKDSFSAGLKDRWMSYATKQNDQFASRDKDHTIAGYLEIPKIGTMFAYLEAGLRNISSRGDSGQGDTKQGVAYVLAELGRDVKGVPIYGMLRLDKVLFDPPNPQFNPQFDATRYLVGLTGRFGKTLGGKK